MIHRARASAVVAAMLFSAVAGTAHADDDPWTGEDKTKHWAVSTGIAAGGYVVGAFLFEKRAWALATGATLTVAAGAGKELVDLAGYGDPSWRDLAWDGLGLITGLGIAYGIDLLVRGVSARDPLLAGICGGIAF